MGGGDGGGGREAEAEAEVEAAVVEVVVEAGLIWRFCRHFVRLSSIDPHFEKTLPTLWKSWLMVPLSPFTAWTTGAGAACSLGVVR